MKNLTIEINVTDEDIREGVKGNCLLCPIARALKRSLVSVLGGEPFGVMVYPQELKVFLGGEYNYFCTPPKSLTDFMWNFDHMPVNSKPVRATVTFVPLNKLKFKL